MKVAVFACILSALIATSLAQNEVNPEDLLLRLAEGIRRSGLEQLARFPGLPLALDPVEHQQLENLLKLGGRGRRFLFGPIFKPIIDAIKSLFGNSSRRSMQPEDKADPKDLLQSLEGGLRFGLLFPPHADEENQELEDSLKQGSGRRFFLPPLFDLTSIIDAIKSLFGNPSRRSMQPDDIQDIEGRRKIPWGSIISGLGTVVEKGIDIYNKWPKKNEDNSIGGRRSMEGDQDDGGDELLSHRRQDDDDGDELSHRRQDNGGDDLSHRRQIDKNPDEVIPMHQDNDGDELLSHRRQDDEGDELLSHRRQDDGGDGLLNHRRQIDISPDEVIPVFLDALRRSLLNRRQVNDGDEFR